MIRRPPRSTQSRSSAASDVYKRQVLDRPVEPGDDSLVVAGILPSPSFFLGALATKQSILPLQLHGLLRGACHRARVRATRWLATTRRRSTRSPARFRQSAAACRGGIILRSGLLCMGLFSIF